MSTATTVLGNSPGGARHVTLGRRSEGGCALAALEQQRHGASTRHPKRWPPGPGSGRSGGV